MKVLIILAIVTAVAVFLVIFSSGAVTTAQDVAVVHQPKCSAADSRIIVDVEKHVLELCQEGRLVKTFRIRLGRGGVGKTREGDGKTPLGVYPLGEPRASRRFGTFIPIGYPTEEQRRMGYTGSDVGVHGPPRWAKWLGDLVNTFDLSDGCVGVARDDEIQVIADWVRATSTSVVELR